MRSLNFVEILISWQLVAQFIGVAQFRVFEKWKVLKFFFQVNEATKSNLLVFFGRCLQVQKLNFHNLISTCGDGEENFLSANNCSCAQKARAHADWANSRWKNSTDWIGNFYVKKYTGKYRNFILHAAGRAPECRVYFHSKMYIVRGKLVRTKLISRCCTIFYVEKVFPNEIIKFSGLCFLPSLAFVHDAQTLCRIFDFLCITFVSDVAAVRKPKVLGSNNAIFFFSKVFQIFVNTVWFFKSEKLLFRDKKFFMT